MPESVGAGEGGKLDLDLPIHARVALLAAYVAARRRAGSAAGKGPGKGKPGAKRKRKEFCGQQARFALCVHFDGAGRTELCPRSLTLSYSQPSPLWFAAHRTPSLSLSRSS